MLATHLWAVFPFGPFDDRWTRSGFLGVDLFFVLSGFLITAILLQEQRGKGSIGFGRFYARRVLRLMPAMILFFVVYLTYSHFNDWPPFGRRDFAFDSLEATFLYYMNWRVLWNPLGAADLTAIWSLSIEEQFYLAWPLLLTLFVGWRTRWDRVALVLGAAAVIVTVWRAVVFTRWGWEAAYLRTDTRIDGLLIGALVASLFVRGRAPRLPRWTPGAVVAVWAFLLVVVQADRGTAYFGGITLWDLASAAMILYLVQNREAFTNGPLALASRGLGRVSYATYLWQLPVLRAVERWTPEWSRAAQVVTGLSLLAVCVLVSWYLVEQPALRVKDRLQAKWRLEPAPAMR